MKLMNLMNEKEIVLGHALFLNWNYIRVYYAASILKTNKKKEAKVVFGRLSQTNLIGILERSLGV